MARVLLSFSAHLYFQGSFQLGCFYSGLVDAMSEQGNEVMVINSAEFLHNSWNSMRQNLPGYFAKKDIIDRVKTFDPELVIAFNHSIPIEVEEACHCPIVIWDVDSVDFLSDKDYIRSNIDKYTFFDLSRDGAHQTVKQLGAKPGNVHVIRAATAIKAEKKPIQQNIAFIGNPFFCPPGTLQLMQNEDIGMVRDAVYKMAEDFNTDPRTILPPETLARLERYLSLGQLKSLFSGQERVTTLNNVADLGLQVWGPSSWLNVAPYLPRLALSYNIKSVYSLEHNQDTYNSSKLCISIAHAQATDGFPWRIMDIMASNGCLVTDEHSSIRDFTKDFMDLPMFKDAHEARSLCKELLKNEDLRSQLVKASQDCIEAKGRWHHRFKEIEDIINIPLVARQPSAQQQVEQPIYIRKADHLRSHYTIVQKLILWTTPFMPTWLIRMGYRTLHKLFRFRLDQQIISEVTHRTAAKK